MSATWQGELQPADLARAALSESLGVFVALYSMTGFIIVRLPSDREELAAGLRATASSGDGTEPLRPAFSVMSYSTAVQDPVREPVPDRAAMESGVDEHGIQDELIQHSVFIVPLRKRSDVDAAFMDRISVGRARNKDIVLRHSSISKFHGWFQVDDNGGVYFADAGSRNGTKIAATRLESRVPCPLSPGCRLQLGKISVTFCPTDLLWRALRLP